MKNFKSHFKFNKQERSGIFFLLLIIVSLQIGSVLYSNVPMKKASAQVTIDETLQSEMKMLREKALKKKVKKQYPFNPNFISDYKGYTLGMSTAEIDRLHYFRAKGTYVNNATEFQKVTEISDSLLRAMKPYFKFPSWKQKKNQRKVRGHSIVEIKTAKTPLKDLNLVTIEDLKSIYGIGGKLSERIIKFRNRLGGFIVDDQLYDVYGLKPEVVERALKQFKVLNPPIIHKININSASVEELSELVYIQRKVAIDIVNYRNVQNGIESFEELTKIENFPRNRIDRIKLYLSL